MSPGNQAYGRSAVLTAAITLFMLCATFVFGKTLQRRAAMSSHQQMDAQVETLFEPVAETSPQIVAEGRKLFLDSCAHCHGADATGDEGPDLHELQVSDRYIRNLILNGRPHEMPSFRKKLDQAKISELIAYLHTL
jgi:mono/diheme cytochrome c family protein